MNRWDKFSDTDLKLIRLAFMLFPKSAHVERDPLVIEVKAELERRTKLAEGDKPPRSKWPHAPDTKKK